MRVWFVVGILLLLVACKPAVDCAGDASCIMADALQSKDSSRCGDITDSGLRTWCYTDVAANLSDAKACADIEDVKARAFCVGGVAVVTNDVAACSGVEVAAARDECLYQLASAHMNASTCASIAQEKYHDSCAYDIAIETYVPADCLVIHDGAQASKCIAFAAGYANDSTICAQSPLPERVDWCVMNLAIKNKDETLCKKITDLKVYGTCVYAVRHS